MVTVLGWELPLERRRWRLTPDGLATVLYVDPTHIGDPLLVGNAAEYRAHRAAREAGLVVDGDPVVVRQDLVRWEPQRLRWIPTTSDHAGAVWRLEYLVPTTREPR